MAVEDKIKIIVVGGGFAGRAAVRELQHKHGSNKLSITVIDRKPFFEFTPATLRCMVHPDHLQHVTTSQSQPSVHFVHGIAKSLSNTGVTVIRNNKVHGDYSSSSNDIVLPFDYCIWATGATYAAPITSMGEADVDVTRRHVELTRFRTEMIQAERIAIIGAGPVGVELAAEVANVTRSLRSGSEITLVASPRGVLPGLPRRAGRYATQHLRKLGVRVVYGRYKPRTPNPQDRRPITYVDANASPKLADISAIIADIAIDCTGPRPPPDTPFTVTSQGWIAAQSTLQAKGLSRVFVAGDVAEIEGRSGGRRNLSYGSSRTAISAEESGRIAACNIITLLQASRTGRQLQLLRFPQDAFPLGNYPSMIVVSLYKNDAVLCLGPLSLHGRVAAKMKAMIEAINVSVAQGNRSAQIASSVLRKIGYVTAIVLTVIVRGVENVTSRTNTAFRGNLRTQ